MLGFEILKKRVSSKPPKYGLLLKLFVFWIVFKLIVLGFLFVLLFKLSVSISLVISGHFVQILVVFVCFGKFWLFLIVFVLFLTILFNFWAIFDRFYNFWLLRNFVTIYDTTITMKNNNSMLRKSQISLKVKSIIHLKEDNLTSFRKR